MQRSSRFWKGATEVMRLSALIVGAVIWRIPESAPEVIGMWGGMILVIFGGGAWVNRAERDPEFQTAVAAREAAARESEVPENELAHPRLPRMDDPRVDDERA